MVFSTESGALPNEIVTSLSFHFWLQAIDSTPSNNTNNLTF